MTNAERKLWSHLRDNQLGVKFRRQFPIEKHVLDFYCHQVRLDVEVDGAQHYTDEGIREDEKRDAELELIGIKVLRYSNHDILTETEAVIDEIFDEAQKRLATAVKKQTPPSSSPKRGGVLRRG
ncbi:MAG: endonuclease domain-containing protein [Ignavibacteriales bacterium]|nr:endonuclease domain-containing protein [Ignavibacteriales bacterium]